MISKTVFLLFCLMASTLSQNFHDNRRRLSPNVRGARRFSNLNHQQQQQFNQQQFNRPSAHFGPVQQVQRVVRPRPTVFTPAPRFTRNFARLLRSNFDGPYADGSYFFDFASDDGITRTETGANAGIDRRSGYDIHSKTGSYSYTSPEGIFVDVSFVADENGFRASAPNLPLGPPPPPHAVEQIRAAQRAFANRGQVFRSGFDNHPSLRG